MQNSEYTVEYVVKSVVEKISGLPPNKPGRYTYPENFTTEQRQEVVRLINEAGYTAQSSPGNELLVNY